MKIELKELTVRELTKNYKDDAEGGVTGYNGKLDIRPPYQREFVYKDKQRDAVIDTIQKKFPLNVMYWAVKDDGTFEVIDGQQRTISICQYVNGDFSYDYFYFHNLPKDKQDQILDYKLMIYVCEGKDSEKLEWFKTINIAGEKLYDQELKNAVYSGTWVTDAKRYFSRNGAPAYALGSDYLSGTPIRQDYLETAIKWISKGNIEIYMANHQHDPNAGALWRYFQSVISWIEATFPVKRKKEMKGIDWGNLYNEYKDQILDSNKLEEEIKSLMLDDDVTNKKGIYSYVLTRKENFLCIRTFSESERRKLYELQGGICKECGEYFTIEQMEADHIIPWHKGGKTSLDNGQMLCISCNRMKSGK